MSPGSLRREIGRLLIAGFDGPQLPVELKAIAREFGLGGVILFARNVADPEQVADLAFEAARLTPDLPVWVSVDQEGGRVARLKSPFTEWPPMATLGRSGDVALAARFARALAEELKAVGVTLDYAPVLDIHTNPKNPVIGDRALGDEAARRCAPRRRHRRGAAGGGRGRLRQALSRPRRHVAPTRITSCRSSSTRSSGCATWNSQPFRAAIAAGSRRS